MIQVRTLKKAPVSLLQEIVDANYKAYFVDRKFYKEHHRQNSLKRFRRDIEILDAYAITHKNKKLKEIAKLFNLSTTSITTRVYLMVSLWDQTRKEKTNGHNNKK